jgi:hypothetical protein
MSKDPLKSWREFVFAFDRVKALVPEYPEWKTTQPFQAVLEGDAKAFAASGEKGLVEIITATHSGMTPRSIQHDRRRLACHHAVGQGQAGLRTVRTTSGQCSLTLVRSRTSVR